MNENSIIIREALPEDAEQILTFMRKVGGESDNLTFGAEGLPITIQQESEFLQAMIENPRSVFYCALIGETLVGTGSLTALPRRMNHRAEVAVSVPRAAWGHGIGSKLMEALIGYAKSSGIELLSLETRSDNTGMLRLCEKYGFSRIGTHPAFFKINGEYVDFELMYLDLRDPAVIWRYHG